MIRFPFIKGSLFSSYVSGLSRRKYDSYHFHIDGYYLHFQRIHLFLFLIFNFFLFSFVEYILTHGLVIVNTFLDFFGLFFICFLYV